jgi:hypothetical protein
MTGSLPSAVPAGLMTRFLLPSVHAGRAYDR